MTWTADEVEMMSLRARQLRRNRPTITQEDLFWKVQGFLPKERRCTYFRYEEHGWIHLASHRDSMDHMAGQIAEILRLVQNLVEERDRASDPHWVPLVVPEKPDGEARLVLRRLGISIENSEQVAEVLSEALAGDPFAGSIYQ